MKALSVVIVNFNSRAFLGNCLMSLKEALPHVDAEIIVVDNASTDESGSYFDQLQANDPFFSIATWIGLKENLGFSKANNIGIQKSEGDLVLLLNPDTLVTVDAIQKCVTHFYNNPQTGAVGVRMVDAEGKFLKESKRGYPSLTTTFIKSIGLSSLFPRSGFFGKYHMGEMSEHENAKVAILSGAFMMIRKKVLQQIGGLDERFFMYGEDIDLSIRISNAGWNNIYLGEATIIHFKGGSTDIGSISHLWRFYEAMILFVEKYYNSGFRKLLKPVLYAGIFLKGVISVSAHSFMNFFKRST